VTNGKITQKFSSPVKKCKTAMTQKESSILLTALTAVQELIEMEARKVNFDTHNKSERLYIRGLNKGLDIAI
jgi:hypothetical protein